MYTRHKILEKIQKITQTDIRYLLRSSLWLNANYGVSSLTSFILSIGLANFLSKDTFGIYQFIISFGSFITAFTLTGMNTAITKAVASGDEGFVLRSIKSQLTWNTLVSFIPLCAAIYYLYKGNILYTGMLVILAIAIPYITTYNSYSAFLIGKGNFRQHFLYTTTLSLIYVVPMLIIIYAIPHPLALVCTYYVTNALGNYLLFKRVIAQYSLKTYDGAEKNTSLMRYGKKLSISNILPSLLTTTDTILVYHFIGPAYLAIYTITFNIPERIIGVLRTITSAAVPKFSKHTPESLRGVIVGKVIRMFLVASVCCVVYILCAPFLFHIFFPSYSDYIGLTRIASISSVFAITASFALTALISSHQSIVVHRVNTLYPLISIISIVTGITLAGITGAVIGKGIGAFCTILIVLIAMKYTRTPTNPQEMSQ